MNLRTITTSLVFAFLSMNAFALGDHAPKTPLEQAEAKIALIQAVGAYSQFQRVSVPIPKIFLDPIYFSAQVPNGPNVNVEIQIKKVGFRWMFLANAQEPVYDEDDHPIFHSMMQFGEFHVDMHIKFKYLGFPVDLDIHVVVDKVYVPADIHALQDKTRIVAMPEKRKAEFKMGFIHMYIKGIPDFVNNIISDSFGTNAGGPLAQNITQMVMDIPDIPAQWPGLRPLQE